MSSSLASWRISSIGALATGASVLRHLGARLGLDLDDQAAEHVVEQPDMVFVEVRRAVEEQIGDALERLGALVLRAVLDDVFKLGDQRRGRRHSKFLPADDDSRPHDRRPS